MLQVAVLVGGSTLSALTFIIAFLCKRKADEIFEPKQYGLLQLQWEPYPVVPALINIWFELYCNFVNFPHLFIYYHDSVNLV